MGLDISVVEKKEIYGFRAGSYSGFSEWREKLASLVGVDLGKMEGFGGNKEWKDNTKFIELLDHSDCEGILTKYECEELNEDFKDKKILQKVADTKDKWFIARFNDWKKSCQMVSKNENREIRFC